MVGKTIEKYAGILYAAKLPSITNGSIIYNITINEPNSFISSDPTEAKVMIATSLRLNILL